MKKINIIYAALLAVLALTAFGLSSQAQTTNLVIYNFNTNQVAQDSGFPFGGAYEGWGNWFGNAFVSDAWDPTEDSSKNPASGSLEVNTKWEPATNGNYYQYVEFDGFNSGYNLDMFNVFTNISFDIKYAADSCTRTNADGSVDFGNMRFGAFDNYNQDWLYYFAIPATNGLGQPNTNWTHIQVSINTNTFSQFPDLVNIQNILFSMDGGQASYGNTNLSGTQTYWIDNIQAIGPAGGIVHPPPVMSIQKTTPALRNFVGADSIYARSQLTTVDQNQSWIGGTYPVSYSFTLLTAPNISQVQIHFEVVPVNHTGVNAVTGDPGLDYATSNLLWLQILGNGNGGYTAKVAWKTNAVNNNPNHTELSIANTNSPVGTWTVTFNSATSGTLTAPGTNSVSFTIHDPNVTTDFGNPAVAIFGNQPNGVSSAEGLPTDYSQISVTGVAGVNENDVFANDDPSIGINPGVWDVSNSDQANNTLYLVSTNTPYWVTWTYPAVGFSLQISPDLTNDADWHLPAYYNNDFAGDPPNEPLLGKTYWTLIPDYDLPSNPSAPSPSTNSATFFRLANPAPNY